jgi:hypothetical protein
VIVVDEGQEPCGPGYVLEACARHLALKLVVTWRFLAVMMSQLEVSYSVADVLAGGCPNMSWDAMTAQHIKVAS